MNQETERQKLYKLEKEIVEKGAEFSYSIIRGKDDDYLKYVISKEYTHLDMDYTQLIKILFFMKLLITGKNFLINLLLRI